MPSALLLSSATLAVLASTDALGNAQFMSVDARLGRGDEGSLMT